MPPTPRPPGPAPTRDDTTVVIATRARPARLAECLDSIAAGTVLPRTVIAVAALTVTAIVVEPLRLAYAVAFCLLVPGSGWAVRAGGADAVDRPRSAWSSV